MGASTPKCYFAFLEDHGDCNRFTALVSDARTDTKMVLLIEDLGEHQHYAMNIPLPHNHALSVAKNLARMHAAYWNKPIQDKKEDELLPTMHDMFLPDGISTNLVQWAFGDGFAKKICKNWEDSDFGRLSKEIPNFEQNLQNYGDTYEELIKPFSTTKRLQNSKLFQNLTLVHGDMHPGNICIRKDNNEPLLYDWQCYGYGQNSTELAFFVSAGAIFDPDNDQELLHTYYDELTGVGGVSKEQYPYGLFEREVMIRFLSYGILLTGVLLLETPASVAEREAKKARQPQKLDNLIINMYKRIFHYLHDSERNLKNFILTGK